MNISNYMLFANETIAEPTEKLNDVVLDTFKRIATTGFKFEKV